MLRVNIPTFYCDICLLKCLFYSAAVENIFVSQREGHILENISAKHITHTLLQGRCLRWLYFEDTFVLKHPATLNVGVMDFHRTILIIKNTEAKVINLPSCFYNLIVKLLTQTKKKTYYWENYKELTFMFQSENRLYCSSQNPVHLHATSNLKGPCRILQMWLLTNWKGKNDGSLLLN